MVSRSAELIGIYGAGGWGQQIGLLLEEPFVFIDDTPEKQGTTIDGVAVISLQDFAQEVRETPNYILYIGIMHPGFDFYAKQQEINQMGLNCLPFTRAILDYDMQLMFFEPVQQLRKKLPCYDAISHRLADDESRRVLEGHLMFRQSGIFSDLVIDENQFPDFLARAFSDDISYVDVGAYDGDTIADFVRYRGERYHQIYALEPDSQNMQKLVERFPDKLGGRLICVEAGLSTSRGRRNFLASGNMSARLSEEGTVKIETICWQDIKVRHPAYFNLDIEGEEPAVICASADCIAKDRPLLAISVYHAPDDLLEIFETLSALPVDYRFYLRCHDKFGGDLMLYAI